MKNELGILGRSGFIGSKLVENFRDEYEISPKQDRVDITNPEEVDMWMKNLKADVVILASAYTNVKLAQEQPELVEKINVDGVRNVARSAKKYGKHIIYFSTGFVFTGNPASPGPYKEDLDPRKQDSSQRGVYAESKLRGEEVLKEEMGDEGYAIVRLDFPFGNEDFPEKDYVIKLAKLIKDGKPMFNDQVLTSTYIKDLINGVRVIAEKKMNGIFHIACIDPTSPHEFGNKIIKGLGINAKVAESSIFDYAAKNGSVLWSIIGGLDTKSTQERLNVEFSTTDEALADFLPKVKKVIT